MKLLYFFDEKVKPYFMRGKKYCHPTNTVIIGNGVSCIRENDVNMWFYTKNGITIAFDAGHLHFKGLQTAFDKIGIDPNKIETVFLTHADVDHAGGIDLCGANIYPNANIYLGSKEEPYLKGDTCRITKMGIGVKNCVRLHDGYKLLEDGDIILIGDIRIHALHIPGHTLGHMCYFVDDTVLISGDCLAVNKNGGYSFFDFFTQDPDMNKQSLFKLKKLVQSKNIMYVCTGHSGIVTDMNKLFSHCNESAVFSRKHPFDETAPSDYRL